MLVMFVHMKVTQIFTESLEKELQKLFIPVPFLMPIVINTYFRQNDLIQVTGKIQGQKDKLLPNKENRTF